MKPTRSIGLLLLLVTLVGWTTGCSREAKRDRHWRRAETYFAAAEYEKALIEYQNVLRLDPTNRTVLPRVARILFEQGSPLRAMQAMQASKLEPEDPVLRCRVAEFRLAAGDHEAGRAELLALLTESPTNREVLRALVGPGTSTAELTNTLAYLRQLDQQHPDSAPILLAKAALLIRERQVQPAEALVVRALRLEPESPDAHLNRGLIYLLQTNQAAADESFATAVRLAPSRSPIRLGYAQAKLAIGKPDDARALLEETLKDAPDYLPATLLLARVESQEKDLDQALALTGRILSRDSLNFEARQLRTQLLVAKGQPEQAAAEWEQFERELRPIPFIKMQVARAYLASGDTTKAGVALDQIINLSSNRLDGIAIEAHLLRARLDLERRNPLSAVESLSRLLSRTNAIQARVLLLDAQRQAGRGDEAIATCEGLVRDDPENPAYPLLLGRLLRERGRFADAREAFRQSLELQPGNPVSLFQLVDLELAATNAPAAMATVQTELARTNTAALRFLEGRVLAAQRLWPEAEVALQKALDLDAGFSSAYQLLAGIYLANTNLAGAARELEAMTSRKTNDVRSIMLLGTVYDQMGQPQKASEKYEEILRLQPSFSPALNNLAYVYSERLPNLDRALDLAQQARRLAPEDPAVADTLGWVLYRRGNYLEALPLLVEAAEKQPDTAEIFYHLGMTRYMLGQPEAARLALERAAAATDSFPGKADAERQLALLVGGAAGPAGEDRAVLEKRVKDQPNDLTARSRLAAHYAQAREFPQAKREYEEILRQNPRSSEAALRLAELNAGPLKDPSKALELARKARELAPADPEVAALLGHLAFQSGDHLQAYGLLQSAAQQRPRDAEVQYDFAWAAYSMGRVADADQAMRRVLDLEASPEAARAARAFVTMTDLALNPQRLAEAGSEIQGVLKADPNHAPALMAQAAYLQLHDDPQAAAPLYEKVRAQFPRFTPATRNLGLLLATDPAQAAKAYDLLVKTRETAADDLEVARALAVLSYQRRDYRYAIPLLQAYVRDRPTDAEALFYLGMSQYQANQDDRGKDPLEKAIEAGLRAPFLAEAKQALAAPVEKANQ